MWTLNANAPVTSSDGSCGATGAGCMTQPLPAGTVFTLTSAISTTTALVTHLLREAGHPAEAVGNIGSAAITAAAEVGRQPWIVWGLMKTVNAVSPAIAGGQVLASIVLFSVIYLLLLILWIVLLDHKIKDGPEAPEALAEGPPTGWLPTAAEFHDAARRHSLTQAGEHGADSTRRHGDTEKNSQ